MAPTHPSLTIAAITGAGASLMQSATASPSTAMLVPIISAVVGGAVSYGILKGVVHGMERDLTQMRRDMGQMYDLLREFSSRISHIEGRLEDR